MTSFDDKVYNCIKDLSSSSDFDSIYPIGTVVNSLSPTCPFTQGRWQPIGLVGYKSFNETKSDGTVYQYLFHFHGLNVVKFTIRTDKVVSPGLKEKDFTEYLGNFQILSFDGIYNGEPYEDLSDEAIITKNMWTNDTTTNTYSLHVEANTFHSPTGNQIIRWYPSDNSNLSISGEIYLQGDIISDRPEYFFNDKNILIQYVRLG